jgi:hypothetical protein
VPQYVAVKNPKEILRVAADAFIQGNRFRLQRAAVVV